MCKLQHFNYFRVLTVREKVFEESPKLIFNIKTFKGVQEHCVQIYFYSQVGRRQYT